MVTTVKYISTEYSDGSGSTRVKLKTFENVENALGFIEINEEDSQIRDCQLLVDYSQVEHYKVAYEKLIDHILSGRDYSNIQVKDIH